MDLYLLNDKSDYNLNYRSGIIKELEKRGVDYENVGLFDGICGFLKVIFLLFFSSANFMSSNIKSNVIFMLFVFRQGTVIVNGLGRKRRSRFFRFTIYFLIKINKRKKIAFQNYADYRYFSYILKRNFYWVPGSGGTERKLGTKDNIVIVSRDSKIPLIGGSISFAFDLVDKNSSVVIVGCSPAIISRQFSNKKAMGIGFVPQPEIFSHGHRFFQPTGYGEGIPHTLVDAICSGMQVYIYKKDFLSFGLNKVGIKYHVINESLLELIYDEGHKQNFKEQSISLKYLSLVHEIKL